MKKTLFVAVALFFCGTAISAQTDGEILRHCDTIAVFIVYIDSVAIFAAYPEYDERIEVVPGWQVQCPFEQVPVRYFDRAGREMPEHRVILTKRRTHKPTFKH